MPDSITPRPRRAARAVRPARACRRGSDCHSESRQRMSTISSPSVAERAAAPAADPEIVRDEIVCRVARTDDELAVHFRIRREIFVDAQGLFDEDDRDEHDDDPATLHVVAMTPEGCVGAVRLYPIAGDRQWKGDRLAVSATARSHHAGPRLVRWAAALGGG